VLPHAAAADPKFFAIIGDMDLRRPRASSELRALVEVVQSMDEQQYVSPLVHKTPIMGVQDDHDYGLDGCWADTWKVYTAKAYADVIPGAQYPNAAIAAGARDVDCWLLGLRRYKDRSTARMKTACG